MSMKKSSAVSFSVAQLRPISNDWRAIARKAILNEQALAIFISWIVQY
jgi:hypothetical protein